MSQLYLQLPGFSLPQSSLLSPNFFTSTIVNRHSPFLVRFRNFALVRVQAAVIDGLVELGLHRGIREMLQLMGRQMNISGAGSELIAQIRFP
jgi:hypothetical protein